jgi:hypothetical protein
MNRPVMDRRVMDRCVMSPVGSEQARDEPGW